MGIRSRKGNASRRTKRSGEIGGNKAVAACTTTKANAASLPPSPLTTLPAELIMKIACELDHRSYLQLARAWRPFLHEYAQGLDPWNTARLALQRACLDKPGLFQMILSLRYDDRDYNSDTDSDAGCSCCSYLRCAEGEVVSSIFCTCVKVHADKDAIIVALYDYMLLDSYRRHSELPLFSKPVAITFHRAAAIADLVFDKRRARGIAVGACPHDRPPFKLSVDHPVYNDDIDMRYTKEADIRKALGHADLPLSNLELLKLPPGPAGDDDARYNNEAQCIVRALTEGSSRLTSMTIVFCRATPVIMDALGHGCRKLTALCVTAHEEPTINALIRAIARMPAIQTVNMAGSDLNDPTLVQTLANVVSVSTTLQNLYLPYCYISNEGVEHLAQALRRNTTLRALALSCNRMVDDIGACALAAALRANPSTAIRDLYLNSTQIGDSGAFALAKTLVANRSVTMLELRNTIVGAAGSVALEKLRLVRPFMSAVNNEEAIASVEAFLVDGDATIVHVFNTVVGIVSKKTDLGTSSNAKNATSTLQRPGTDFKPLPIDILLDRDQFGVVEDDEDEDDHDEDDDDSSETTEGVR